MYEVGDKIVPMMGEYSKEVCAVTGVEERQNGEQQNVIYVTYESKDGRIETRYRNEIRKAYVREINGIGEVNDESRGVEITIQIDGVRLGMAKRFVEDCTEEEIKQRIDSLTDGIRMSIYMELEIPTIILRDGRIIDVPKKRVR